MLALAVWALVAPLLTDWLPAPLESPAAAPSRLTVAAWLMEGVLVLWVALGRRPGGLLGVSALIVLWLASRALPYNHLTAPEAYHALRPATAFLKAAGEAGAATAAGSFLEHLGHLF